MIIGITGGTGCGKTTLLTEIEKRGGLVLDCDAIYHELLTRDDVLLNAIDTRFPGVVENGALQRKRLGAIVFADPQALAELNAITHGAIRAEVERRLADPPALAAIDAIALFEGGLARLCDVTVAVTAPEAQRVERLMARDGITREYAESRVRAQHDEKWFAQRCDTVLRNDGTRAEFEGKCRAYLDGLSRMC
ncbi:MAG: dephospho-CoA kinase [Oscillospiraceae bacterium]|nr:dephospho-CoA kinase [Oscillospiraceae bacterium]